MKRIYIPIWLDLLLYINYDKDYFTTFTFQYGQIYYEAKEQN